MKTKINYKFAAFLMLNFLTFSFSVAFAQDAKTSTKSEWSYLVEPYLLFPNMSGTVGLADLPELAIDADTNEIFGNLKMGAMLYAEASNDFWAIGSDLIYMELAQGVKSGFIVGSGEFTAKQFAWEVSGLRKVNPWLEFGVGGILNSVNSGADINLIVLGGTSLNKTKEMTKTWFDPMLITRIKSKAGEKFVYQFRGEIGGFGIGSDLAWQMQAVAGYQFSKLFSITGGYRIISLDYESGSGQDYFHYNIDTSGPTVLFGFQF
ncbi:MAG: hypothetical protein C0412_12785 [Flavobacterium sp.]|jgi:hypothetical protein|nr:hypothetical protein [Flavobacterium sp.]